MVCSAFKQLHGTYDEHLFETTGPAKIKVKPVQSKCGALVFEQVFAEESFSINSKRLFNVNFKVKTG